MYSRKKNESRTLNSIGSQPIGTPPAAPTWKEGAPEIQLRVWLKTRQTFCYHVCDTIAQGGWPAVQTVLNEIQRELENLYDTPRVELVNVYRKTQTKADGICIAAIYKIGPLTPAIAGQEEPQRPRVNWKHKVASWFDP